MGNTSPSRTGKMYLATQSTFGVAVAVTGSNACRHTKCIITNKNPRERRRDKTGTLSQTAGIGGLRMCDVEIEMDLAGSGTPGTPPDCNPILASMFGVAPTGSSYAMTPTGDGTAIPGITVAYYRLPSTMPQFIAHSVVFSEMTISFNDGVIAKINFKGQGVWAPSSKTIAQLVTDADALGTGGLSTVAAEPSTPVTNGHVASAFRGSLTINSIACATLKKGTLTFRRPVTLEQSFGTAYPTSATPGVRNIGVSFSLKDTDDSFMAGLLIASIEDATIPFSITMNTVAGNIWTWGVPQIQISPPAPDDSSSLWLANFEEAPASASTVAATDELTLVIT